MLNGLLKMLVLALPQIHTLYFTLRSLPNWRVRGIKILAHVIVFLFFFFHLGRSRALSDVPHSLFRCRDPKLCLMGF